jgi:hypothetical protein
MLLNRSRFVTIGLTGVAASCVRVPALGASRLAVLCSPNGRISLQDLTRFVSQVEHDILSYNIYTVVSRDRLADVLQEQGLSNSAYADPATAARLGRIVGASQILHVDLSLTVNASGGAFVTTVRVQAEGNYELIGVSTARIINAGSAQGADSEQAPAGGTIKPLDSMRQAAIDACAADLVTRLMQ